MVSVYQYSSLLISYYSIVDQRHLIMPHIWPDEERPSGTLTRKPLCTLRLPIDSLPDSGRDRIPCAESAFMQAGRPTLYWRYQQAIRLDKVS